jgi:sugar (pentulose or hexulose) kinase
MARADLIGHLNTYLHRQLTGARVIDPSNASFTGLYLTGTLGGWSDELCQATGISPSLLPQVMEANAIAGRVTTEAVGRFGLTAGTPVQCGMVDTSAAMLLTGAADGQMFHMCGSTDVLAVACDRPHPHEHLLTRGLGVGKKWISAATLAAAGSSLDWVHANLFSELSDEQFHKLTADLAAEGAKTTVGFEPYLAGERAAMEQKQASFSGLTLAASRRDMLAAVMESLAAASAARVRLLAEAQPNLLSKVFVSGGGQGLADLLHRDWPAPPPPGRWQFQSVSEANLRGLAGGAA